MPLVYNRPEVATKICAAPHGPGPRYNAVMDENPYLAPGEDGTTPFAASEATPERYGCLASVMFGVLATTLGAFPIAALVGLAYRFPIPFSGYESGVKAVVPSLFAVLFYGLLGGFPILAVAGAIAGLLTYKIGRRAGTASKSLLYLTLAFALVADLLAALFLSVLDKIIGPW